MDALWMVIPLLTIPLMLATFTLALVAHEKRRTASRRSDSQPDQHVRPVGPEVEVEVFGADPADWQTPEGQRLLGQMLHLLDGGSLRLVQHEGDRGEGGEN